MKKEKTKKYLTTLDSMSASIFLVICRLVWPNDEEDKKNSALLSVSSLQTSTTGGDAAFSYNFRMWSGRVAAVNSDVAIVLFFL